MNNKLFGSFSKKVFWQHTTLNSYTFCVLSRVVGPILKWKNTNMRENIHIEIKVAMVLTRLGNENLLQPCKKVYGIVKNTTSL